MVIELIILSLIILYFIYIFFKKKKVEYFSSPLEYYEKAYSIIDTLPDNYQNPDVILKPLNQDDIIYIEKSYQLEEIIDIISSSKYIGVDIEESRKYSYIGYICLIQISSQDKVYLIDTLKLRKELIKLRPIFFNKNIVKIFHGSHNDTQWLLRDFGIVCINVFDTQIAAKNIGLKLGLNYLWKKYCNYIMTTEYKKQMQTSRWDLRPLSKEQLIYGANDAHYLIYLMHIMLQELNDSQIAEIRIETNKICKKPFTLDNSEEKCMKLLKKHSIQAIDSQSKYIFFELFKLRDQLAQKLNKGVSTISSVDILIKISYEKPNNYDFLIELDPKNDFIKKMYRKILEILQESLNIPFEIFQEFHGQKSRKEMKKERYKTFIDKYTIKKKVYENCQIQAPDGEILCYADSKKANWYVDRSLADVITLDPLVIRLNFEPNGRGFSDVEADQMYYSKEKKNECVCCGNTSSYLRYHVVPVLYRQYFPDNYKNHRSHDVVLLCASCHEIANKKSDIFKKQLAEEYKVPLNFFGEMHKYRQELRNLRKLTFSLGKNWENMPEDRKNTLISQIHEFVESHPQYNIYLKDKSLKELIEFLRNEHNCKSLLSVYGDIDWKKELGNSHGKLVVEKLTDLKGFIRRWRCNFIESLQPKYLPDSWNVDHLLNSPKFP